MTLPLLDGSFRRTNRIALFTSICLIAIALFMIFLFLIFAFPHLLDGPIEYFPSNNGDLPLSGPPNTPRNFFELLYFGGSTIAFFIAVIAIFFTIRQAAEAERTRLAGLFVALEERWASPQIQAGVRKIREIVFTYHIHHGEKYGLDLQTFFEKELEYIQKFLHEELTSMANVRPEIPNASEIRNDYLNVIYVVHFFDYLAYLSMTERPFIKIDDLVPLFGHAALEFYELLGTHLGELRRYTESYHYSQRRANPPRAHKLFEDLAAELHRRFD